MKNTQSTPHPRPIHGESTRKKGKKLSTIPLKVTLSPEDLRMLTIALSYYLANNPSPESFNATYDARQLERRFHRLLLKRDPTTQRALARYRLNKDSAEL